MMVRFPSSDGPDVSLKPPLIIYIPPNGHSIVIVLG